jgi:hypothetical protein
MLRINGETTANLLYTRNLVKPNMDLKGLKESDAGKEVATQTKKLQDELARKRMIEHAGDGRILPPPKPVQPIFGMETNAAGNAQVNTTLQVNSFSYSLKTTGVNTNPLITNMKAAPQDDSSGAIGSSTNRKVR